ncbi:TIGR00282 family metallophosphoesterase [Helicobacter turcicus]|uniref:YmdB family metallophosphoesterase n=1 Tax=Helicobacter turcicus TaxID=2867412 RepID=A0ABS7JPK4_9HELI|nr:TIGR00282 family metallophosphoesterase [Helicobacter turcicus]MBX7491323.1 YmdB family metallophosphoesterase [Helicobacter turcicus]MBX7546190.1 YmdB family metallophosphoesterase [Helicobacter turcicus]
MRFGFIGDIVGKIGREQVTRYVKEARSFYNLDVIIANGENASHGFGLGAKSVQELQTSGVDIFTGGNHTWDKKEVTTFLALENSNVLRPHNYPKGVVGSGVYRGSVGGEPFAVLNLMGHFGMPQCDNAFICANVMVDMLHSEGIKNIIVDFHAEATSEKRAMFMMLKGRIAAIIGTHTHIGTDDLEIFEGSFGVSDVGMSGARESVIGMECEEPIKRFLTGIPSRLSVPEKRGIPSIFQMIVCEISYGKCIEAFKLKAVDNGSLEKTLVAK